MEEILKQILNELEEMHVDIKELKKGHSKLEVGQEKLQNKVETEIDRLSRQ